jgi:very-short-patch-repair endonuclease
MEPAFHPSPERGGWLAEGQPGGVRGMANARARELRKSMTPQEVKLWVHLRSWKSRGYHFRRQAPRAGYILDFVCLRERIIVEVDGGQHNFDDHAIRDRERDAEFLNRGFKILRFWNNEVDKNLPGVLQVIDQELTARSPHPVGFADHPPPQAGEG